jgi:hypothetical protein
MRISDLENTNIVLVHDGARDQRQELLDVFESLPTSCNLYEAAGPEELAQVASPIKVDAIVIGDGVAPDEKLIELIDLLSRGIPVVLVASDYESGEHLLKALRTDIAGALGTTSKDAADVDSDVATLRDSAEIRRTVLELAYMRWVTSGDDGDWLRVEQLAAPQGASNDEVGSFDPELTPGVTTKLTLRYLGAVCNELTLFEAIALAIVLSAMFDDSLRPVRNANGTYRVELS